MSALYVVTLMLLVGSDILPSKVQAGSSGSKNSGDSSKSGDNDEKYCKQAQPRLQAVQDKIKTLNGKKQPLPTCVCGSSGTISKVDIFDASCGKTTSLATCSGCSGPQVPVRSAAECNNVADCFRGDLDKFCTIVLSHCKSFTVYRCTCPTVSTTQARTAAPLTTTSSTTAPKPATSTPLPKTTSSLSPPATTVIVTTQSPPPLTTISSTSPTSTPLPTTTSVPPPVATTQSQSATITVKPTPFFVPGYKGYEGYYP